MSYLQNSFFISLLIRFWDWVCARFQESLTAKLLSKLIQTFTAGRIWLFLTRNGVIGSGLQGSCLLRAVQWCLDLPVRLCARIGSKAPSGLLPRLFGALVVPALGVMMLLLFVIPQTSWNNLYSLVMVLCILALYLASSLSGQMRRLTLQPIGSWPCLFAIVVVLSWFWSDSPELGTRFLFFAITCMLLVLLVVSATDTERKLIWLVRFTALGLAICSLYACYQRYVGVAADGILTDLDLHAYMPGRVYSFFENPNSFANLLVFFAPLMLCMAVFSKKPLERVGFLAVFLLSGLALLMTFSRGGWLALAFAMFVLMLLLCPRWVPLVIIVGLLALPLLPDSILMRLLSIFNFSDSSTYTRGYIYSAMLKIIGQNPIFGVGLGAESLRYSVKCAGVYLAKALFIHGHNIYLQIWAESGIFALIAFLGSIFFSMRAGRRAIAERREITPLRGVIAGCISGLSGSLIFGITDYAWSYPRIMVMFWFLFALLLAATHITNNKEAGISK